MTELLTFQSGAPRKGNGPPSSATGSPGDLYLDIQNWFWYGPKTLAGEWGEGVPAQGEQGEPGARWRGSYSAAQPYDVNDLVEYEGSVYISLAQQTGANPLSGEWELFASKGDKGDEGPDAYDVAVAENFSGTRQEWLDSLRGPQGDTGEGVPEGGTEGQYMRRGADGLVEWSSLPLLNAYDYGVTAGGDVTAAFQALADDIPVNGAHIVIPPGAYTLSSEIALTCNYLTIVAWGARFNLKGLAQVGFSLNPNATVDETVRGNNVRWFGGAFQSTTTPQSNANIGIRVRGITRGCIKGVIGSSMGDCFIDYAVLDGFHLEDVHGFNNRRDVRVPEFSTVGGNPQSYSIQRCGFSASLERSISIEKMANTVSIRDCYFNNKDGIVISTGNASVNSRQVLIESCTFEQAHAGEFYIRTENPYGKTLKSLSIRNCDFNEAHPKIFDAAAVEGLEFEANHVMSSASGMIRLDANCKNINIGGSNVWVMLSSVTGQAIEFSCPRSEINAGGLKVQPPDALTGWAGQAKFTGTGVLDMSSVASDSFTKLIPPKAWLMNARIEDPNSVSGNRYLTLTAYSTDQLSAAPTISCAGLPNNTRAYGQCMVPADNEGNVFYSLVASPGEGMKVVLSVCGMML